MAPSTGVITDSISLLQISTNALRHLIHAMIMQTVPIRMVHLHVTANPVSPGMEKHAQVHLNVFKDVS